MEPEVDYHVEYALPDEDELEEHEGDGAVGSDQVESAAEQHIKGGVQEITDDKDINQLSTYGDQQMTDLHQNVTDGDQQMADGDQQMTDGDQNITDNDDNVTADQQMTDGDQQMTDDSPQVTDGNQNVADQRMTDDNPQVTDGDKLDFDTEHSQQTENQEGQARQDEQVPKSVVKEENLSLGAVTKVEKILFEIDSQTLSTKVKQDDECQLQEEESVKEESVKEESVKEESVKEEFGKEECIEEESVKEDVEQSHKVEDVVSSTETCDSELEKVSSSY